MSPSRQHAGPVQTHAHAASGSAPPFSQTTDAVLDGLGTDMRTGLPTAEAAQRLAAHGPNVLSGRTGRTAWRILAEQLSSLMVLLLIGAAVVSGLVLHEVEDAVVILVVVVLNAALGFRQEYKAEQALAALKKLTVPSVRLRRDGRVAERPAPDLVPGDIVLLEAGSLVPADCRLVEAAGLRVQEAALTGEAEPVGKHTDALPGAEVQIGDRTNMAHMGTIVTYGRGTGVVTATGMRTELGHIANLIQEAEEEDTVLQRKLDRLSRRLVAAALVLIAVVAVEALWVLRLALQAVFMTAVSMAVAAIPEGLPAAVTIALAIGAQRMLKRKALIRRLPAVETLGSVTVICSDKTGTLTQNRMTVTDLVLPGCALSLPADPQGRAEALTDHLSREPALGPLLAGGALCNDAELETAAGGEEPGIIGDPTEGALLAAAAWTGWEPAAIRTAFPRRGERPFDSERKRMTTLHQTDAKALQALPRGAVLQSALGRDNGLIAFTKGAVSSVLEAADRIRLKDRTVPLTEAHRADIQKENDRLAGRGIRVLAVAMRRFDDTPAGGDVPEANLVVLGLVGMLDPLRPEVIPAVETCHHAGIRPVMITGDHPLIAATIGHELKLNSPGGHLTGRDLAGMDRADLEARVKDVSVYARVSPEHKLKIVDALQKNGHVVAMTGDGVNDAPALKEADIGVAMGVTGTDVSKQAADMVLQDDNFATIVAAVEQGRIILDNIVRFVRYILASNWAEILVMLAAPLLGLPLPLIPVQILWMNLVTDGLPALALGVEPGEKQVMRRPPRRPGAPIITRATGAHILVVGALMALVALVVGSAFFDGAAQAPSGAHGHTALGAATTWQTMVFTVLVVAQVTLALAERSDRDSFFTMGVFTNPYMIAAVTLTVVLQMAVVYVPLLQRFFKTTALSPRELAVCLAAGSSVFFAVEAKKLFLRLVRRR